MIVGGGVVACATAYFLAQDPTFDGTICVLERDPTYRQAASALSASSIRQQFSSAVNIQVSQFGISFLRRSGELLCVDGAEPDVALTERSYLYLATETGRAQLQANAALQASMNVSVELLDSVRLAQRYPWLNTHGIAAGAATRDGEGWFDGYSLLQALRRKARSLGVSFATAEAARIGTDASDKVTDVLLTNGRTLKTTWCVCAAGTRTAGLIKPFRVDLPVRARKRCVFVFDSPATVQDAPLVIDPSGLYFRPEGRGYICGLPPSPDPDIELDDFDVDSTLFDERIWPILAHRVPGFEELRCTRSWAGHYDYNLFDQNAFVGPIPHVRGLLIATGFSGHGLQQAPAVGRALAESIVYDEYRSLDLSALHFDRFLRGVPLIERSII